jgi:hypothetical protein
MSKPRFELVVRIVKDDPAKTEPPEYRQVLYEIAVPIMPEWNLQTPPDLSPEQVMGMTPMDLIKITAAPVIDQMQKAPLDTMTVQCMQGFQDKLARASVAKFTPVEKKEQIP